MKMSLFASLLIILGLISTCMGSKCSKLDLRSGTVVKNLYNVYGYTDCWTLDVPQNTYLKLDIQYKQTSTGRKCPDTQLNVTEVQTNKVHLFCFDRYQFSRSIITESGVQITLKNTNGDKYTDYGTVLNMTYHIEDLICVEENSFRCSNHSCIHQSKVCDGVKHCDNGHDELNCVKTIEGVNVSQENVITWLQNQKAPSFGWGKNTHRAVTALYLGEKFSFQGQNLEEELIAKQLELDTSLALLRNTTDPLSVGELSMFVDALTVTCHDPRRFYGENLLKILAERVSMQESPSPRAYLTLCNLNWTLTESDVRDLLKLVQKQSKYPFLLDVQAVTVMALACAKNRIKEFSNIANASNTYFETIKQIVAGQHADGSFGNVYTTALVTQALIASNKLEAVKGWNMDSTMQYLMKQLNSTVDFLSAYLAVPIFSGKSLTDIREVNCANSSRHRDKNDISDITTNVGAKKRIQFSLFIGDRRDVIHTIYLRMPENSTAYDIMRVAQVIDPKYKFHHRDVSGHMYVYEIAGITNDPEASQFWLLYTGDTDINGEVEHHFESPDRFFLGDAEHLIMWYKTAHI